MTNSQLDRLKAALEGKELIYPDRCMVFGAAFHQLILEPKIYDEAEFNLRPSEIRNMAFMQEAINETRLVHHIIKESKTEQVNYWTDTETGLKCKAKIDLLHNQYMADLKTTSCYTRAEFEASLSTYDYDRQAAFFLDGTNLKRYIIIGVMKRAPFHIYLKICTKNDVFIQQGRQKYKALLQILKQQDSA